MPKIVTKSSHKNTNDKKTFDYQKQSHNNRNQQNIWLSEPTIRGSHKAHLWLLVAFTSFCTCGYQEQSQLLHILDGRWNTTSMYLLFGGKQSNEEWETKKNCVIEYNEWMVRYNNGRKMVEWWYNIYINTYIERRETNHEKIGVIGYVSLY